MTVLGRFGKWVSESRAFGALVRTFGKANEMNRDAAGLQAISQQREMIERALERRTRGAYGHDRSRCHNPTGSKLSRKCGRAYKQSKQIVMRRAGPKGDELVPAFLFKLNVRGF